MTSYFDADETKQRLSAIGERIRIVDGMLLSVVAMRMELAGQVAWTKSRRRDEVYPNGEPISRPEVENDRLNAMATRAKEYGVDPNLARTLLSILIDHSCKQQMIRWQSGRFDHGEYDYDELKANLLELTALVAPSYQSYDRHFPATKLYREFELGIAKDETAKLDHKRRCLDLGTGGGALAYALAELFEQVIGVDISADMIKIASENAPANVEFQVADLETEEFWSLQPDNSFDFITLGLGCGSMFREIRYVVRQIDRVLSPGGRFVLTFYNTEGLVHKFGFQPWLASLAATLDTERSCLRVHTDNRVLTVYAKPYTTDEIDDLIGGHSQVTAFHSHPTVASVLPREVLENQLLRASVEQIDKQLAGNTPSSGAYLIASGRK